MAKGPNPQIRNKIYVRGLPSYLSFKSLVSYFEKIGTIETTRKDGEKKVFLYQDKEGGFNGCCKVTYLRSRAAKEAVQKLNGQEFKNTGCLLEVSIGLDMQGRSQVAYNSDWICDKCGESDIEAINFEWQDVCYHCKRRRSPNAETVGSKRMQKDDSCQTIYDENLEVNDSGIETSIKTDPGTGSEQSTLDEAFERTPDDNFIGELEDGLSNYFMNYNFFKNLLPLQITINVCRNFQAESKTKPISVNLKIHDDLKVVAFPEPDCIEIIDERESEAIVEEVSALDQPINSFDKIQEDVTRNSSYDSSSDDDSSISSVDSDIQRQIDAASPDPIDKGNKKRSGSPEAESLHTAAKVPKTDLTATTSAKSSRESVIYITADTEEESKSGKSFSLDEDKEILKKVIEVLPGKSLANLELPDEVLRILSVRISRAAISISQRWKHSLRTWLVQYYSKNTKSWKNFSKQASLKRREDISSFFHKLVQKSNLSVEVMIATKK